MVKIINVLDGMVKIIKVLGTSQKDSVLANVK